MEWCRLATGAVGVTKMAVGATFCYYAFQESRRIELFLCMVGAAASALGGWAIINMALYPREDGNRAVPQQEDENRAVPQQEDENRAVPQQEDQNRAVPQQEAEGRAVSVQAPHDLLRAFMAHLRNLT